MKMMKTITSRFIILTCIDLAIFAVFAALAELTNFIFGQNAETITTYRVEAAVTYSCVVVFYFILFGCFHIQKTIWRYAIEKDFLKVLSCAAVAVVLSGIVSSICFGSDYHIIMRITFLLLGTVVIMLSRIVYRAKQRPMDKGNTVVGKRLLIVGSGDCATRLLDEIQSHPTLGLLPVGLVDDDVIKIGRRIRDIEVLGNCTQIAEICKKYNVQLIYIAVPSADAKTRTKLIDYASQAQCEVKILPYLSEMDDKNDFVSRVRDITPEELLGREPIKVIDQGIMDFVKDKTVMITGGGGSIGSELCRQIAAHCPKRLVIVDIYENNAYAIQQELKRTYHDALNLEAYIASVRDYDKINFLISKEKPDILLHAAAHKHVPLMEVSPEEAIKNNVFGTYNTALAAMKNHVKRFTLISTDKAVNPTNIMGASKRVCEMVIQYFASQKSDTTYAAVRFGNVLGSNGSVIPLFKEQISKKEDVTVTDPRIIRYFMTIPEASQLVLAASIMAKGGEIFVLDMGEQVKILDLAKKMISLSGLVLGRDIKIRYIGLRPGEKLYEELLMAEEGLQKTANKKIFIGHVIPVDYTLFTEQLAMLKKLVSNPAVTPKEVETALMEVVPTFKRCEPDEINKQYAAMGVCGNQSEDMQEKSTVPNVTDCLL